MAPENGARFLEPERFCCDSTVYMELQHLGFNGKLFYGLFFVVWLICMYRNGLLHQRETGTHKAAKGLQYFAKRNETKRNGTLRNGTLRNGYNTMLHHTLSRVPRIPLKAEDL